MHRSNRMFRNDKEVHARVPDAFELATDQERRKMFLRHVNRGWLILGIVTLATLPFFPHPRREFTFLIAVTFPTYLIVRFLNLSGKTRLAGIVFTLIVNFGFYGVFLVLIDELGPYQAFDTQATVWMLMGLAVLFAGAVVDKWAAPVVALFNTILLVATRLTLAPGSDPRPSVIVFWWMLALTIWLYERALSRSLERAWTELAERRKAEMELQESRNFLQQVVDTSPSMIFVADSQGKAVFVNRYAAQYYGTTPEQLIAKSTEDIHHQESEAQGFVSDDQEVIRTHARIVKDELNTAPTGEQHWFHTVKVPLLRSDGTVEALGISTDITERKQAEKALQESERNLKRAQRIAHVGHWTWDTQTNRVILSDEIYRIFGLDPESFDGSITDLLQRTTHPDDMAHVLATMEKTTREQNPTGIEYRIVRPDRAIRHVWAEPGDQVTDESGQILKLSGIVQDITERKQAEEELQRQRDFAVQVMNAMGQGLTVTGSDGLFEYVNPAYARMIGRSPEDLIGNSPQDVTDEEGHLILASAHAQRLAAETSTYEIKLLHIDGKKVDALITGVPRWSEGRVVGAIAVVTDLTDRKRAEETLIESEERFRSLSEPAFEGIMIHDQGIILNANRAFADLFSYRSPEDLIGKDGLDTLTFAPESRELIRANLSSGSTEPLEIMVIRPDGSMFPAETQGRDITFNGRKLRVVAMRDITKRKQAEEKIQRQLQKINALRAIDRAINSSLDMRVTLDIVLQQVVSQLGVDASAILLFNPYAQTIEYAASRGFRSNALRHTELKLGEGYAGRVFLERETIHIPDLMGVGGKLAQALFLAKEEFVDYYGTPLIVKGEVRGVLEIFQRSSLKPDAEWMHYLETLAGQAAIAIDNAQLFNSLQRSNIDLIMAYDATIVGWSRAMDLRDKETEGHTRRVTELSLRLADLMGLSEVEQAHIRRGALLHDMGKLAVPDSILFKTGELTDEEWEKMRQHPQFAYDMLSQIDYLKPAMDIPYCHHERWNGQGYPRGLKGAEIPLAARIFAVVDVWDALRSDRPYRAGWPEEKVLEYLHAQAGRHFDPQVVEAFLGLITSI